MLGQHGHFALYAAEKIPYAIERYRDEAARLYGVLDRQLGRTGAYVAGDYSIADIACYPWMVAATTMLAEPLANALERAPAVQSWLERVGERPAVQKGMAVLQN